MPRKPLKDEEAVEAVIAIVRRVMKTDDPVVVLIRGAILTDLQLQRCLDLYLLHGLKPLDSLHLSFQDRLILARAVGLISQAEFELISGFNLLRNRVAHRPQAEITGSDEQVMLELFERHGLDKATRTSEMETQHSFINELKMFVLILVTLLFLRETKLKEAKLPLVAPEPTEQFWNDTIAGSLVTFLITHFDEILKALIGPPRSKEEWSAALSMPPPPEFVRSESSPETTDDSDSV